MPRPVARLRMGYFPLHEAEARRIRQHLIYPASGFSAIDPCAGEGKALAIITDGARGQRCGIELDAYRAESCSLLYENPPYDVATHDDVASQRLEALFLQHTYRWLKPGGILILVIRVAQLAVCGNILSINFKDTEVYRLNEPDGVEYKQIVVFGVRRTRRECDRLQDCDISGLRLEYGRKARSLEALPVLTELPQRLYAVPGAEPINLTHRGLPLDEIEDFLTQSAAYRQARRILFAPQSHERSRPLTPLHSGHVSILACAGALDGILGEGELRHVSRWQIIKTVRETEEEDERGVTTIRQREEFSHSLNLLYSDGHTAVLTADPPPESEERANQNTAIATYSAPVERGPSVGRKFRLEEA